MPITPAYSWSETPAWVTVEVLLQSVSQSALDIITTDCYIKVNCLPYLFQADLHEDIDSNKSSAHVDKSVVKFYLVKKTETIWGRLTRCGDRNAILERRQKSLDAVREAAVKTKAEAKGKIAHIRRGAVSNQMKLEAVYFEIVFENREVDYFQVAEKVRRKTIEARKEAELSKERDSLKSWQNELEGGNSALLHEEDICKTSKNDLLLQWDKITTDSKKVDDENIPLKESKTAEPQTQPNRSRIATLKPGERIIPAPRKTFRVLISFTQKTLPNHLPARESREKELQLKKHSPISNDLIDVSEREPLFLQDKGDKFYSSGDFMSAINAYTAAVRKDASMILCYANRAACYLQTNQLQACVEDCTVAMKLLDPEESSEEENRRPVDEDENKITAPKLISLNKDYLPLASLDLMTGAADDDRSDDPQRSLEWKRKAKSCVLSRRGCAKCHIGDFGDAIADFKEAMNLNPSNSADIRRVLDCIASLAIPPA